MGTPMPLVGSPTPSAACATVWGQCGGNNWDGPFCCEPGNFCFEQNEWYSQCTPGSGSPATTSAPSPVPLQPATTPAPSPEPAQPAPMPAPLPGPVHPTPSPLSGPRTCMDFCPKTVQSSCSALSG